MSQDDRQPHADEGASQETPQTPAKKPKWTMDLTNWLIGILLTITLGGVYTAYQMGRPHATILWGLASWVLIGVGGAQLIWSKAEENEASEG